MPEYLKIASRLAPKDGTTYDNPTSSLELVIENLLLTKNNSIWQTFCSQWDNTLRTEAETAFEGRIKIYKNKGWSFEEFYTHLSKGCFPLHPLTAYLLCNLDFTQDRTAIQFIKGYVKNFIETQPVENAGKLNYIYPIALVDTFIENFSNSSLYNHYKKAVDLVADAENGDELMVIKALFLYEASGEKLTKADQEEHQEILVTLTGLTKLRLQTALDKLEKERDLIYHRPEIKLYRFCEGINPKVIQEEIEEKIRNQTTSINDVVAYCDKINILRQHPSNNIITATQFVKDNKLVGEDWRFERKIYSLEKFIKALENNRILRDTKEKGILAYVLTDTQEELQEFRNTVANYLCKSPIKNYIAVAISREETGNLARVILQIKTLEETNAADKRLSVKAYQEQLQRWQEEANTRLTRLLNNCTYHCVEIEKIPSAKQRKAQRVISLLLQDLYPFVPPVDEIDKMRSGHLTGRKIIRWTATQIFIEDSFTQNVTDHSYRTVIDQIFVKLWGLLKKTSDKYIVQEPTHEKIRAAWDKISEMTDLEGLPEKIIDLEKIWQVLSGERYGYSEYNFTILLSGWLAIHRKELSLRGKTTLDSKTLNATLKTQSLKDWGNTDILQDPTKFVHDWIVKQKSKLIRRQQAEMPISASLINYYDQAQEYLEVVAAFLEFNEPDELEKEELTKNRKQIGAAVAEIGKWLQPVQAVEKLPDEAQLTALLPLYPQLRSRSPDTSILPTQQQRDRFSQAFQTISNKIDQLVAAENKRAESLSTEQACNTYKIEIQGIIDQITQIADLPPHLIESLQNALRTSNIRLTDIRQQAEAGQKQAEDTQIIQNIRNSATKIKTIHLSQAALQEIENLQSRFNYPDKFQHEVAEIVQSIQNKIISDRSSLANLRTQLQSVKNLTELDVINTEYAKVDVIFQDSVDYRDYQELQPQIQSLKHDLEQIQSLETRYQQSDSITSCNDVLAIIASRELNIYNADRFQERISQLEVNFRNQIQEYEQKQSQILQQQQAAAQQWIKDLENNCTQINKLFDDADKLEAANNLLEQIQAEKSDYINLISVTETQSLENIERQCVEEREKDITNQIFVLLRQLPHLEQQNVYERLGQILSEKTEE
ncbi:MULTISPECIES: hypothetical protein [unclassified Nostoc]|uniref:hypothetical protein n=1 Tax=unclassified Nostoc TaxID=2593658 RepID=UPI0026134195|nr:hypothetical protein [Nostoc sp. S13]MDF5738977.1 hypothetical protein [Nostoc sp. S13]